MKIKQGSRVISVRAGNNYMKGTKGTVLHTEEVDSEKHLSVILDNYVILELSPADHWEIIDAKGTNLRNFTHDGHNYEQLVFPLDDDRVECRDEEGKLIVYFNAHCTAYLPGGEVLGQFSHGNGNNWQFQFVGSAETITGPSTKLPEGLLDFEVEIAKKYITSQKEVQVEETGKVE